MLRRAGPLFFSIDIKSPRASHVVNRQLRSAASAVHRKIGERQNSNAPGKKPSRNPSPRAPDARDSQREESGPPIPFLCSLLSESSRCCSFQTTGRDPGREQRSRHRALPSSQRSPPPPPITEPHSGRNLKRRPPLWIVLFATFVVLVPVRVFLYFFPRFLSPPHSASKLVSHFVIVFLFFERF